MKKDRDHASWVAALVQALEDGTMLDLAPGEGVDASQAGTGPHPADCRAKLSVRLS